MNRRSFLKRALIVFAAAAAAPTIEKIVAALPESELIRYEAMDDAALSGSDMLAMLKEIYSDKIYDLYYNENPLLKLVKPENEWVGKNYPAPLFKIVK